MTDSNMSQLWPLFWDAAWETLYIVAITLTLGGFLGLLLGLGLYVTRGGGLYASRSINLVLNVLVNFFRPIPFVIFIAAVQPLARLVVGTGIGNPAIIFALTLAAAFGISRIVEQNLVTVDPGVIEAARSVGARARCGPRRSASSAPLAGLQGRSPCEKRPSLTSGSRSTPRSPGSRSRRSA